MPFEDVANPLGHLTAPASDFGDLPQISLGYIFDKACDLLEWVSGVDVRAIITDFLAGDMPKVGRHLNAWENLSQACDDINANLERGRQELMSSWSGNAADAASAHLATWGPALALESTNAQAMGENLHDVAIAAIDTAQAIVDTVKLICSVISAGLASASIPIYGEYKLWQAGKTAWQMFQEIRKVISVFTNLLHVVKDVIVGMYHSLTIDALPTVSVSALPSPSLAAPAGTGAR